METPGKRGERDRRWPGPSRSDLARLGALAAFACALVAVLLPLPLLAGGGRPAWVDRYPRDPDAYVGIGRADKRNHPDTYRDLARDAALAQISREISTEISSSTVSVRREDAAGWEESFSSRTAGASQNHLAGYRLEGVHETQHEFWAYYALDKEAFRAGLDAEEKRLSAWLEGEAASLSEDLEARRLQAAADRHARILALYRSEFDGNPSLKVRASPLPAALDALSATMTAALRGLRLESGPTHWEFIPFAGAEARGPAPIVSPRRVSAPVISPPVISLTDGTGRKWIGPFSLILSDRLRPETAPCPVETDAEGRLDPARAFLECGMEPGGWNVTWKGPHGGEARAQVTAALRKRELGVVIRTASAPGEPADPADRSMAARGAAGLSRALVGTQGRFHRIVGGNAVPVVEIRVREAALDSLDGIFFATLRADALFPGAVAPVAVRGKAGHPDKDRAWARAQGDFAKALNAFTP